MFPSAHAMSITLHHDTLISLVCVQGEQAGSEQTAIAVEELLLNPAWTCTVARVFLQDLHLLVEHLIGRARHCQDAAFLATAVATLVELAAFAQHLQRCAPSYCLMLDLNQFMPAVAYVKLLPCFLPLQRQRLNDQLTYDFELGAAKRRQLLGPSMLTWHRRCIRREHAGHCLCRTHYEGKSSMFSIPYELL